MNYSTDMRAVWRCMECGERRVYGFGMPEKAPFEQGRPKLILTCQHENKPTRHEFMELSMDWVGKASPMGEGMTASFMRRSVGCY